MDIRVVMPGQMQHSPPTAPPRATPTTPSSTAAKDGAVIVGGLLVRRGGLPAAEGTPSSRRADGGHEGGHDRAEASTLDHRAPGGPRSSPGH
ncbi:hypothetical protein ONE63_010607 [Megalurothrips usitatus]|uniref:Uncharacterized protein n=1 Tax=Megalurothrips usitatus TaxID=439358 RepID=A0AAV7XDF2_9NEOP|nr:hypothetical protein ONE63_010607 [Megalurothrips usitatus]